MLTTVEGIYRAGRIELTETPAGIEQAPVLVTFLPRSQSETAPQALYGIWKDKVAPEFDVEAAVSEIRGDAAAGWESIPND